MISIYRFNYYFDLPLKTGFRFTVKNEMMLISLSESPPEAIFFVILEVNCIFLPLKKAVNRNPVLSGKCLRQIELSGDMTFNCGRPNAESIFADV